MKEDISISYKDSKFKYRVSGILLKDNKLLTVKINNNDFYCLPGGHVEIMEDTKEAVIREFKEETKLNINVERLLYITENFFTSNNCLCHELGFYYLLNTNDEIEIKDFDIVENDNNEIVNLKFKWMDIDNLYNFKPEFLKTEIKNIKMDIKHFVIKDDNIV